MRTQSRWLYPRGRRRVLHLAVLALLTLPVPFTVRAGNLPGLNVIGVAADGTETGSLPAYRWLVEKDKTYHVQTDVNGTALPTVFDPTWDQLNDTHPGGETLSVGFHQSYMPVVAKGCVGWDDLVGANPADSCANDVIPATGYEPNTHYYVSVVPRSGYTIGGASFVTDGAGNVPPTNVYVNQHPIETAQITILVFNDNAPINNAPDLPTEDPGIGPGQTDMSGFTIIVEDAGGRYGASAGIMSQDAFGNPLCGGACITGPDGRLTIKNLAPGKYGIQAVPPTGDADLAPHGNFPGPEDIDRNGNGILDNGGWQQTATIEGTKVIDAWVKAGEPPYFAEFGPPGFHAFIGFVKEFNSLPAGGTTALSGTIVNQHMSRPPDYAFYNGGCFGHTTPWVGLNEMTGGVPGKGLFAAPTNGNCEFSIPNVPPGSYQLAIWDSALDLIFGFHGITINEDGSCVTPNGDCNLGEVPVFQWFHRSEHRAFDDLNANGMWDDNEGPTALETGFNLRWRDGTIYQGNVSDGLGAFAFDQVFPFFSWLVAEVDFVRNQATGVTVVVDDGGAVPASVPGPAPYDDHDLTFGRAIAPQDQTNPVDAACGPNLTDPCTETADYRVERGPVLTQGFQGFIGQTNAFLWGKRHYPDGENGGITGIVFYAVTRAENDPEYAAAEVWEPGIPGVTVNLYAPVRVAETNELQRNPDGTLVKGALLNTATTDSWDESRPTGCKWGNNGTGPFMFSPDGVTKYEQDCWDGLRMFNQVRPAVFDGGYAFDQICLEEDGLAGGCASWSGAGQMPVGDYLVEVIAPAGYEILKPEDKNVDFGDAYNPPPALLPPPCVGDLHRVPPFLTLFPDEQIAAPFANQNVELCDTKLVTLSTGANAAADFWLFTEVPVAAHALGFILDDTQNEFDPNAPNFGEKFAPPFVPITIRDFTGRMISKTLSDQYGLYNFLAPSTITTNLPAPSGMSPNMLTTCMNDPGDDPNNPDPNWNQLYSTFCYNFQYMPGVTTYLDTPVVPVAAFTGRDQFPLDCEYPDGTPRIHSVDIQTNGVSGGPYIPTYSVTSGPQSTRGEFTSGAQTITINSMGPVTVQNPNYCNPAAGACPTGSDTTNKFVTRDYGFGAPGTVTLGDLGTLSCTWGEPITCTIPANTRVGEAGAMGGRQLTVTRGGVNGQTTKAGVTVQVGLRQGSTVRRVAAGQSIQAAINAANANDLILVEPGQYNEMVVMWKPVQLQGWGEGSTTINALKQPTEKLAAWRAMVDGLVATGAVDLLPGQEVGPGTPEPVTLWNEEGAGVLVLAKATGDQSFDYQRLNGNTQRNNREARIDGFTIKSADTGGGIIANGYADYLQISNNRIANNSGFFGGGIRVGHPLLTQETNTGRAYSDGDNDYLTIHHNQVVLNGGLGGAGGGITLCTGSDSYAVTENWVCGNYSLGNGGGIGHIGLSDRADQTSPVPLIADNELIFNENFFQGSTVSGGGIFIGGAPPLVAGGLTPGAGNVQVLRNLIQGNSAGSGDGGGIRLQAVNGQDVANNPSNTPPNNPNSTNQDPQWYSVEVFNNLITNNVSGLAGGGISLQDTVAVSIRNNTIAHNDSLATAGDAFTPGSPNQSTPQPGAGMVSRAHSKDFKEMADLLGASIGSFSSPTDLSENILWQNRQFHFWVDATSGCVPGDPSCTSTYGLCPDPTGTLACTDSPAYPVFSDLGVIGATGDLTCSSCVQTGTGGAGPMFLSEYVNGARSAVVQLEINTGIQAPAAFDEGGNFIRPGFGPLSLYNDLTPADGDPGTLIGNYHIQSGSMAANAAARGISPDIDGDTRPTTGQSDIGADEIAP